MFIVFAKCSMCLFGCVHACVCVVVCVCVIACVCVVVCLSA